MNELDKEQSRWSSAIYDLCRSNVSDDCYIGDDSTDALDVALREIQQMINYIQERTEESAEDVRAAFELGDEYDE